MILIRQNPEAAGLTGYIQQLKLCYCDIASLPYIPMSAVVDTHTKTANSNHE